MNAYSTRGQARIRQHDITTVLRTHRFMAASSLAALERQRGGQVDADVRWLLKQNGVTSSGTATLVASLRRALGSAFVRFGQRVQGATPNPAGPDETRSGTLSVAG